jgi:hypothetical protein
MLHPLDLHEVEVHAGHLQEVEQAMKNHTVAEGVVVAYQPTPHVVHPKNQPVIQPPPHKVTTTRALVMFPMRVKSGKLHLKAAM